MPDYAAMTAKPMTIRRALSQLRRTAPPLDLLGHIALALAIAVALAATAGPSPLAGGLPIIVQ